MEKILKNLLSQEQEIWLVINGISFKSKITNVYEDIVVFTYQYYRKNNDTYETWERAVPITSVQGVEHRVSQIPGNVTCYIENVSREN